MASTTSSKPSTSSGRKLSCRLCQRRKKRCNKQSPCSNCIKLDVVCQPSTPAPPRPRRQPTKELLARLAWCEEQLRNTKKCQSCLKSYHASGEQCLTETALRLHDSAKAATPTTDSRQAVCASHEEASTSPGSDSISGT